MTPSHPPMPSMDSLLTPELNGLRAMGLYRRLRRVEGMAGPRVELDGRTVLVLGSNNYLGLAGHPALIEAAVDAARRWGVGATGSRLTTGCLALLEELEQDLARLLGTEAALLFPSGYQAAVGTIPALVERGDLILSDALNHACLIDGCRLSRGEVRVFRHADAGHARELLADRERFRRCLLVTDGVFSMDGDLAPLPELAALCEDRDAWLMVDDAHGIGVLGARGAGSVERWRVEDRVPVRMGTLSKALGSEGGFVCGSEILIEYLRNRARSFIFSTAPAPPVAAAAREALRMVREEPERRVRLAEAGARLRSGLAALELDVPAGETPIIPVILGEPERAVGFARELEAQGVWVPAIRPPSVPEGSARLRVSVMATHEQRDLEEALEAFQQAAQRERVNG